MFGSILSGIPWSRVIGSTVTIQNQTQVVFSIVALVTIICLFLTIFGVKDNVAKPESKLGYYMSLHMWLTFLYTITSATVLLMQCTSLVFVGTVVYGGAQSCPVDSECYHNYVAGVRVGCFGLALAGATNIVFSLSLNWITKYLKLKTIYLIVLTVSTIAMAAIYVQLSPTTTCVDTWNVLWPILRINEYTISNDPHIQGKLIA